MAKPKACGVAAAVLKTEGLGNKVCGFESYAIRHNNAEVAQLVEREIEDFRAGGSNPSLSTIIISPGSSMAEHLLGM